LTGPDGIYAISAGSTAPIALDSQFPGVLGAPSAPRINAVGDVVFSVGLAGEPGNGIYMSSRGALTPILSAAGPYESLLLPDLNDAGDVALTGTSDSGVRNVLQVSDGVVSSVIDNTDQFSYFRRAMINERGDIAFVAGRDDGTEGIYRLSDGVLTTVVETGGLVDRLYSPAVGFSMNNHGDIAYGVVRADGAFAIEAFEDGQTRVVVDTYSEYGAVYYPGMMDDGNVAFAGVRDDGNVGLYYASADGTAPIVSTAAPIFGDFVTALEYQSISTDPAGKVAFYYRLSGGGYRHRGCDHSGACSGSCYADDHVCWAVAPSLNCLSGVAVDCERSRHPYRREGTTPFP
jgi:hypothetical protein